MNRPLLLVATVLAVALGALLWPRAAFAAGSDGGEMALFHDVYVQQGETVGGDLNVVFGDARVAGTVLGDCNAIFGSCTTVDGGRIFGRTNGIENDSARAFVPWVVGPAMGMGAFAEQDRRLLVRLASSAIVVLVFLLFPLRTRIALDRVERHPALSALTGAIAAVAVIPIAIALLVSIVGIPLILLEVAALFIGVWLGTGAVALVVGRRLCELVMPRTTPSPLLALLLGLVVVCSAEIVPVVGWVVTALVWLAGLGAAVLSFVRAAALETTLRRAPIERY